MSILDDIRNTLETRSDNGLRFECMEISCSAEELYGFRCYHNYFQSLEKESIRLPSAVKDFSERISASVPGLRFFDYSERSADTYSVSFLVDQSTFDFNTLDKRNVDRSRLIQFGYLIDSSGNILETKEYYPVEEDFRLDGPILDEDTYAIILRYNYAPQLYGVNKRGDSIEEKLYFQSTITTLERMNIQIAYDLIRGLSLPEQLTEATKIAYEHDLWLKGFGYSEKEWRFYYFSV